VKLFFYKEGDKQQADDWILAGGANPPVVLHSVASFDAETVFVMLMQLMKCNLEPMYDIESVLDAVLAFEAFLIVTDNPHLAVD